MSGIVKRPAKRGYFGGACCEGGGQSYGGCVVDFKSCGDVDGEEAEVQIGRLQEVKARGRQTRLGVHHAESIEQRFVHFRRERCCEQPADHGCGVGAKPAEVNGDALVRRRESFERLPCDRPAHRAECLLPRPHQDA